MTLRKKSLICGILLLVFGLTYCGVVKCRYRLISVDKSGDRFIGQTLVPVFFGGDIKPDQKFYMILISAQVPGLDCVNEECGPSGKEVVKSGGALLASVDGKVARWAGVKLDGIGPRKQLLRLQKPTMYGDYETTVLLVVDQNHKLIGIYENAQLKHIKRVIKELDLS